MDIAINRGGQEKKFFDLCQGVVNELGLSLYDLEYLTGPKILRLFIMNPKTKTALIEDCVAVDSALTPHFEQSDWIPSTVTLEVSSPGVYRNLREKAHFDMVLGQTIEVVLFRPLDEYAGGGKEACPKQLKGQKKANGLLKEVNDSTIEIVVNQEYEFKLPYEIIKKANAAPSFEELSRMAKDNGNEK